MLSLRYNYNNIQYTSIEGRPDTNYKKASSQRPSTSPLPHELMSFPLLLTLVAINFIKVTSSLQWSSPGASTTYMLLYCSWTFTLFIVTDIYISYGTLIGQIFSIQNIIHTRASLHLKLTRSHYNISNRFTLMSDDFIFLGFRDHLKL